MSFKAGKVNVGEEAIKKALDAPTLNSNIEFTEKELEFLLVTIKNSLFKGEYVEVLYNLTLKLQNHFIDLKSNNNK